MRMHGNVHLLHVELQVSKVNPVLRHSFSCQSPACLLSLTVCRSSLLSWQIMSLPPSAPTSDGKSKQEAAEKSTGELDAPDAGSPDAAKPAPTGPDTPKTGTGTDDSKRDSTKPQNDSPKPKPDTAPPTASGKSKFRRQSSPR